MIMVVVHVTNSVGILVWLYITLYAMALVGVSLVCDANSIHDVLWIVISLEQAWRMI
jgi:hypothetical protein